MTNRRVGDSGEILGCNTAAAMLTACTASVVINFPASPTPSDRRAAAKLRAEPPEGVRQELH